MVASKISSQRFGEIIEPDQRALISRAVDAYVLADEHRSVVSLQAAQVCNGMVQGGTFDENQSLKRFRR